MGGKNHVFLAAILESCLPGVVIAVPGDEQAGDACIVGVVNDIEDAEGFGARKVRHFIHKQLTVKTAVQSDHTQSFPPPPPLSLSLTPHPPE